jgi:hypothetical protein
MARETQLMTFGRPCPNLMAAIPENASTPGTAYVIRMAHSASCKVVQSAPAPVSPETVNSQPAVRPAHTVVTGGAVPDSAGTDVNINSTVPKTFAGAAPAGASRWPVPIRPA